jgi:SAM-dependent methyltransferase
VAECRGLRKTEEMPNPFDDFRVAEGYAIARPPVHPRVVERLAIQAPLDLAIDLGCGAGLSTAALAPIARRRVGFDPVEAMLKAARRRSPDASFAVAAAEEIPVASGQVDLISAAGSLNYVDLLRFFPEARRVLRPHGVIVIYDFSPGSVFRNDDSLAIWFDAFSRRYPWPAFNGRQLNPDILAKLSFGFRLVSHENFAIPLLLAQQAYIDYMLTETNVARAVQDGASHSEIEVWCSQTLEPVFGGTARDVVFKGYFACLKREGDVSDPKLI